ncbi:putative sulfate exporter family transporter [Nitrosococcus watsonii]|nr:putative sulfate exporter family transporter [Nitrosococcus watsonii]
MATTEDWWAVWLGLIMFFAGLASIWGWNLVGWMTTTSTWVWGDFAWNKALKVSGYQEWHPLLSLLVTYLVFTALTCLGAVAMKLDLKRFFLGWTFLFILTWMVWIVGHEAHFKASVNQFDQYGLSWGLSLGGGFSYMLALAVGLIIGNFFKGFAEFLKEAAKPEWFIKTAIVYLGIKIGLMSIEAAGFTFELAITGIAATFVAYLLVWPIVYALSRRVFRLSREASAVLSSGISICGVSAAIATAGAIRARPVVPVMVSMLIVIFAMIELVVLPGFYTAVAPNQPIVNGAAMGMTVKTDGADAAAGAILDELMRANAEVNLGVVWQEGWILTSSIITKIWIDMFIGVWAFLLALVWVYKVERQPGQSKVGVMEIWHRFPKFVLGYLVAWFVYMAIAALSPDLSETATSGAEAVEGPMRKMMFMLTFVSIGVITDFSKLRGMGKLALLYAIALFAIIAPLAYGVAWIFHHGMMPPTA